METKCLFPQNTLETTIWNCPFKSAVEMEREAFEEFARKQSEVSSLQRKPVVPIPTFQPNKKQTNHYYASQFVLLFSFYLSHLIFFLLLY